jgi:hypothetical protein
MAKTKTPSTRSRSAAPTAEIPQPTPTCKSPGGKLAQVIELLKRPEGATVEALSAATGWQIHSVRGAMSGALKKKHGFTILSEKRGDRRTYRIPTEPVAQEPAA